MSNDDFAGSRTFDGDCLMHRRALLAGMVTVMATPLAGEAQQADGVWRIGVLNAVPREASAALDKVLEDGLRQRGYHVGKNLIIEYRYSDWTGENLPALAGELVTLNLNVIVAGTNPGIAALKRVSGRIPIVMGLGTDPVRAGFIESLARPGGNVTGLTTDPAIEIVAKELQFLKEAAPTLSRVAVLWNATVPTNEDFFSALRRSHQRTGFSLHSFPVDKAEHLAPAFNSIVGSRADGLCVFADAFTFGYRKVIADFAIKHRLPMSGYTREYAEAGALISYGPNLLDIYRGAASYVDRILKGSTPASLPIQQPTKFELVVNRATAKALSLTIPQSLLARSDQVIE